MLRQLRGLGILKSLSDKIELNKGNNNLTLPDIQKMTLFQKIYQLPEYELRNHFLSHLFRANINQPCWCKHVDLSPYLPIQCFLSSISKQYNIARNEILDSKSLKQNIINARTLIAKAINLLVEISFDDSRSVDDQLFEKGLQLQIELLFETTKALVHAQNILNNYLNSHSHETYSDHESTDVLPQEPEKTDVFPQQSQKIDKPSKLKVPNLTPPFFMSIFLLLFILPLSLGQNQKFCEATISSFQLTNIIKNLTTSEENINGIRPSPFAEKSENINGTIVTYFRVNSWDNFFSIEKKCSNLGGELFNLSNNQYIELLERMQALNESFFIPLRKAPGYKKTENEAFLIGSSSDFEIKDPDKTGTDFDLGIMHSNEKRFSLIIYRDTNIDLVNNNIVYTCADTSGNDYDMKKRLQFKKQSVFKLIHDVKEKIRKYIIEYDFYNFQDCINVELSPEFTVVEIPNNMKIMDESNQDNILIFFDTLRDKINRLRYQANQIFESDLPDVDDNYNGNIFNMLKNINLQEYDDLVFLIFFILILLLLVYSSIAVYCISFAKKLLARNVFRNLVLDDRF